MKTNREIFDDAMSDLGIYRYPNIEEAENLLNSITEAAGLGSIRGDTIEDIRETPDGTVVLKTYACGDYNTYEFPASIIDAEDPAKAAKIFGLKKKADDYVGYVNHYNKHLQYFEAKLAEIRAQIQMAEEQGV